MNKLVLKFNQNFSVDFVLQFGRCVPNTAYQASWYNNCYLYPEYNVQMADGSWYRVLVQIRLDGGLMITTPNGRVLSNAFECYCHFVCGDSYELALDWENNPLLFNVQKIPPRINIDSYIDGTNNDPRYTNLASLVFSNESRFKRISEHLSQVCHLPPNTVSLLLLGVFSAMTGKRFNCAYPDGKKVAINLYILAEQSSANSKTRFLEICQDPMLKKIRSKTKALRSEIAYLNEELLDSLELGNKNEVDIKLLKRQVRALEKELKETQNLMPIVNATPESLESVLSVTHGTFSAIASEQGLLNSLLGLSYGKKAQNFDILLNARDGGEIKTCRVGREGYSGYVSGALVCFAQEGTILKMLQASNVTGLFERCIPMSEPDMAGTRDHVNTPQPDVELLEEYEHQCQFFDDVLNRQFDHERLITLKISKQDWESIYYFQNSLESKLGVGGAFSHPIMKRFVGKSRMQIMGLASNLYLFDVNPDEMPSDYGKEFYIPSIYVLIAINMMTKLIEYVYDYCVCNGIINNNEQVKVVYDLFAKHGKLSLHEIKKKCEGIKPFKDLPSPRKTVQEIVNFLAQNFVLLSTPDKMYVKNPEPYRFSSLI